MAKYVLVAETPNGTVTRTTPRNYLHAIVAGRYNPAYIEAAKLACRQNYESNMAKEHLRCQGSARGDSPRQEGGVK